MKTKLLVGTLAAALLAGGLIVLNTHAAEDTVAPDTKGAHRLERIKDQLGLTDAQAAQIKAQLKSEKKNIVSLVAHLQDARQDLRHSIRDGEATEESVRASAAKVASAEADMAVERMKLHGKIMPLLSSDQQKKLQDLEARADKFVERMVKRTNERLAND
ncbi:MAG TPA: Spy/CpxP family protein refolding chaperone [Verrucomicrobiae bacterium]|jgi:Spy/CpxP family protein refolding chaperone|nr:Spy/CpxP family protein refolding chaperone [Verrucomicrobiae bacterium]